MTVLVCRRVEPELLVPVTWYPIDRGARKLRSSTALIAYQIKRQEIAEAISFAPHYTQGLLGEAEHVTQRVLPVFISL